MHNNVISIWSATIFENFDFFFEILEVQVLSGRLL